MVNDYSFDMFKSIIRCKHSCYNDITGVKVFIALDTFKNKKAGVKIPEMRTNEVQTTLFQPDLKVE